jgi:hypothetical protein
VHPAGPGWTGQRISARIVGGASDRCPRDR